MGGLVATELALTYSNKVSKLVTVASSPMFVAQDTWAGIAPKVLRQFESQLAHDYSTTLQRFLAIQAMGSPSAKADILALRKSIQAYPDPCEASLLVGLKWLSEIDLRLRLKHIKQPTLRMYGRLDALVPHAVITEIQALQPNTESYVFEHVSHAPFMTQLDEFVEQLTKFL
jgi:pimeloyl-[acyl-carrier protein] methyl ester esterase